MMMSYRRRMDDSTVYIGSEKPVMQYVTACLQAIKDCGEVVIMGRGRAISKAVDVAEVLRKRFLDLDLMNVMIDTEEFEDRKRVSTIEISLRNKL